MKKIIEDLERISLIEQLEEDGWSDSMIESLFEAADNKLKESIICKTPEELHNAIKEMSEIDEDED